MKEEGRCLSQAVVEAKDAPVFWRNIRHVALDMDDTLVEHDQYDLQGKFAEVVLYARDPSSVTPGRYVEAIKTPETRTAYFEELEEKAQKVFGLESGVFSGETVCWVRGTATRAERQHVVEDVLGFGSEEEFWEAYHKFSELVPRERKDFLRFTEGAEDFLRFLFDLRDKGFLLGIHIVSNNTVDRLMENIAFLRSKGIPGFDHVISARDHIGKKKPEPDAINELSRRVFLQKNEVGEFNALYVGNGDEDVLAAGSAGWTPAIINPHEKDFSSVINPHFRFHSPGALAQHWQERVSVFTRNLKEGKRLPLRSGEIQVVSGKNGEQPLPLSSMEKIQDFAFDIEETLLGHSPWNLRVNFAEFLRWSVLQGEGISATPRGYLSVTPDFSTLVTAEDRKGMWKNFRDDWRNYPKGILSFFKERGMSEEEVNQAVYDFVYRNHSDLERVTIASKLLKIPVRDVWKMYSQFWEEIRQGTDPNMVTPTEITPGVIELLTMISTSGRRIHLITNADASRMKCLLEDVKRAGFSGQWNLVSARDLGRSKPDPAAFYKIYQETGIQPVQELGDKYPFVFFGNAITDLQGAANANVAIAGVVNPYGIDFTPYEGLPPHYEMRDFRPLVRELRDQGILK